MMTKTRHASYCLRPVTLWAHNYCQENRQVLVKNGVVVDIAPASRAILGSDVFHIDTQNHVLIPAGVDPHVHLRVPGNEQQERPETVLKAVLSGGVGVVLAMPNTQPVIDRIDRVKDARNRFEEMSHKTGVRILWSAAITKNLMGKELVCFRDLVDQGVVAFTDDGKGVVCDKLMRQAFSASAELGVPILQHAEYPGHSGILAKGPVNSELGLPPYDEKQEYEMVARDLRLLREYSQARYHVLHVSSKKTIDLIAQAKEEGLNVTCEVTPHHLWFHSGDMSIDQTSFKMNPPLRSQEDQRALRKALVSGVCDFVATDHAPHENRVKRVSFKTAAFGTIGLETCLKVLIALYQQNELSPTRLVQVFSHHAAKFLGIEKTYGEIVLGRPLHAVLVDVNTSPRRITERDMKGLSQNSCFLKTKLPANILAVFMRDNYFS